MPVIAAMWILLGGVASAQSACMAEPRVSAVEAGSRLHGVGDFDGDGRLDAIVGQDDLRVGHSLYALARGDGRGAFALGPWLDVGVRRWAAAVADVDGDGRDDLLATSTIEGTIVVLSAAPDGALAIRTTVRVARRAGLVIAGRVDRDAHVDAIVAMPHELRVLRGDGRGGLRPVATVPALGNYPTPALADLDGDGALDLVFVNDDSANIVVASGRGDGTFAAPVLVAAGCFAHAIVAGDFDRDGRGDAVVDCGGGPLLLRSGGAGQPFVFAPAGDRAWGFLAAGDVTGDGAADIVASEHEGITLLAGDGRGGFEAIAQVLEHPGIWPWIADADGDGRGDVISIRFVGAAIANELVVRSGRDCGPQ